MYASASGKTSLVCESRRLAPHPRTASACGWWPAGLACSAHFTHRVAQQPGEAAGSWRSFCGRGNLSTAGVHRSILQMVRWTPQRGRAGLCESLHVVQRRGGRLRDAAGEVLQSSTDGTTIELLHGEADSSEATVNSVSSGAQTSQSSPLSSRCRAGPSPPCWLPPLNVNLFSFSGDLLHLTSIVIILLKIYTQKTCRGEAAGSSGRSDRQRAGNPWSDSGRSAPSASPRAHPPRRSLLRQRGGGVSGRRRVLSMRAHGRRSSCVLTLPLCWCLLPCLLCACVQASP